MRSMGIKSTMDMQRDYNIFDLSKIEIMLIIGRRYWDMAVGAEGKWRLSMS